MQLPSVPTGAGTGVQEAIDDGQALKQVYQQDQQLQQELRRQNIIELAGGNYIQARPDGVGGVELVPVDSS